MNMYYYFLFTLFAIIVTMIAVDNNVSDYIYLLLKLAKNKIERLYWMVRFHPIITNSIFFRWWMMRKYMRTVKELSQEFEEQGNSDV